jgi:hypothetical protein
MSPHSRRSFVHATGLAALGLAMAAPARADQASAGQTSPGSTTGAPPDWLPMQDPAMVKEVVTVSHFDAKRVRALVERHPSLANASVDWGFGDWEDALGAAAHTGRREIADILLAHGARISIFAAAMLGQLDVVKALVAARPGVQRTMGPHGITLMAHANAGGPEAAAVVKYLEAVGDADRRPPTVPLDTADRDALVGRYTFGTGARDHFDVDVTRDQLGIARPGASRRGLAHTGALVFFPSGVPSVKIAFARAGGKVTQMTLAEPDVYITATRI